MDESKVRTSSAGRKAARTGGWGRVDLFWVALLGIVTLAAFSPSLKCGFTLDDDTVIAQQPHVRDGLTAENVWWALSAFELGYPIPVTLWSFMLDAQVFGLSASWFHAENLAWHLADVLLLYALLVRLTGCRWRSGLIAVVFAVHPLRAESVSWITERKDVLAAFFGLLAMHVYVGYARRGGALRYTIVLGCFALSLLAKPMLAMLPALLLALDYWPLRRVGGAFTWRKGFLEKIPLILISAAVSLVGVLGPAQRDLPISKLSTASHFANAIVSYVRYIGKMLCPRDLSIVYPIVPHWPPWVVIGSTLILLIVSGVVTLKAGSRPWLLVGWIWYVAILLPSAGLHVLGDFSMADRYTYFPMIGLLMMAACSLPDRLMQKPFLVPAGALGAATVTGLVVATWRQTLVWRDNVTLFSHAVDDAGPSYIACSHLAVAYSNVGRFVDAVHAYREALRCKPDDAELLAGLAMACDRAGDRDGAITAYRRAIVAKPDDATLRFNLGTELVASGRPEDALSHLQRAVELSPGSAPYRGNYGTALLRAGRIDEAVAQCQQALNVDPAAPGLRRTLASALARRGEFDAAEQQYELAILNDPKSADTYNELGALSLERKRVEFAITCFRGAIERDPRLAGAHANLGVALAMQGHGREAADEFKKALDIDPTNREAAQNLSRLNAAMGR